MWSLAKEVFSRFEVKYAINTAKKDILIAALQEYMVADKYNVGGNPYTICNIYYDTDDNYLIQKSVSKPVYKEKLRLRGYGVPNPGDLVFLEIKKKYKGVVNKRRTRLELEEAMRFTLSGEIPEQKPYINSQVMNEIKYFDHAATTKLDEEVFISMIPFLKDNYGNEIKYFMSIYDLKPKLYLAYDRLAFFDKNDSEFRVSFDTNIRTRRYDLRLDAGDYGEKMFDDDVWLMEVKINKNLPLWFTRLLDENEIYHSSFSKYGTEYARLVGQGRFENANELRSAIL